jgi:hypothetical protein
VFGVFIFASTFAPLWQRRKDAAAGGSAKHAYIFAGGGVSILAMILSVARGTLGVRSFLGKYYPWKCQFSLMDVKFYLFFMKLKWIEVLSINSHVYLHTYIHTYIPLTLYPRRGSRGISNIPPRHPHFTKIS